MNDDKTRRSSHAHDSRAGLAAFLTVSASTPLLGLFAREASGVPLPFSWSLAFEGYVIAALAALLWLAAGLSYRRSLNFSRVQLTLALLLTGALGAPFFLQRPALALAATLPALSILARVWLFSDVPLLFVRSPELATSDMRYRRARLALVAALLVNVLVLLEPAGGWGLPHLGGVYASLVATAVLVDVSRGARNTRSWRSIVMLFAVAAGAGIAVADWKQGNSIILGFFIPQVAALVILPRGESERGERIDWWDPILREPPRLLAATFLALAIGATILLSLRMSSSTGESVGLLDAAFTATSAACVTGLVVLDTGSDFSFFGQLVIILTIQLGGLGIMSFSTAALSFLGRRMSLRLEGAVAGLMAAEDRSLVVDSVSSIFRYTLIAEGCGAVLLTIFFIAEGDAPLEGVWRGLFTSISAFCNAGFALQSDSLVGYRHHEGILHTVALLNIVGGLSPLAVASIPRIVQRRIVPVQARIVILTTAILLFGFALTYAAFEWHHTLEGMPLAEKLTNAWFQSATARTAGFNSLDVTESRTVTHLVTMVMMFIGGSPGGTAGGIKTTTAAVLVMAVIAAVRGQKMITIGGRRVSHRSVYRATATAVIMTSLVLAVSVLLMLTQRGSEEQLIFEAVSALGTVGLSIGATGELDGAGKVIITVAMYIGRVGSLTLFMFLSSRVLQDPWQLPKEDIEVG